MSDWNWTMRSMRCMADGWVGRWVVRGGGRDADERVGTAVGRLFAPRNEAITGDARLDRVKFADTPRGAGGDGRPDPPDDGSHRGPDDVPGRLSGPFGAAWLLR